MGRDGAPAPALAVALIAGAALAFEILLIRIFAVVHWQALVATAISLALLGYGASGSFLALTRVTVKRHRYFVFVVNALAFAVMSTGCAILAQRISFDPLAMAWDVRPVLHLFAIFTLLSVPFFAAANSIGLALMAWPEAVPRLYGADLVGAGAAAVALLAALTLLPLQIALALVSALAAVAAVIAARAWGWRSREVGVAAVVVCVLCLGGIQAGVQPAAYKDLARALTVHGAERLPSRHGADGVVDVVRNREVPSRAAAGMSLMAEGLPPSQERVFLDGDTVGSVPDLQGLVTDDRHFSERLSALPFRLLQQPRVVVLGAGAGEAVRQALALDASRVDAVEANRELRELACEVQEQAPAPTPVCGGERLSWWTDSVRSWLAQGPRSVDLLVVQAPENSMGLAALKVDFTLTTEAFSGYLDTLSDRGLLAVEVPSRVPPRLTVRLVATAAAALADLGLEEPGAHIAVVRGWQRVLILVSTAPLSDDSVSTIRAFASRLAFDLVWLPGIDEGDVNRVQRLSRPFFHDAVRAVFTDADGGSAAKRFHTEPVSDDRPFPHRFTSWSEILAALRHPDTDGSHFAQMDAALLAGIVTLVFAVLASLLLILLPLRAVRDRTGASRQHRWQVGVFFGLIGIAFLYVEIAWIQRLQVVLGHPVYATTVVLATFLVFAGLGSLWSQTCSARLLSRTLLAAVIAIVLLSLLYLSFAAKLPSWIGEQPLWLRFLSVTLLLAPLAFAMGIPFPTGLRTLVGPSGPLLPWAWGINGCASVVSAASAPLLAIEIGFSGLIVVALLAYAVVPLVGLVRSA